MRNRICRKILTAIIISVLLISQAIPVLGAGTDVRFESAGGLVSLGKVNCYPDKGKWSTDPRNSFYIEAHPDTGDEIKPTDINKSFSYQWSMPLKGINAQAKDGLIYKVKLQVFGQFLDGDVASIFLNFWGPGDDGYTGAIEAGRMQKDFSLWNDVSFSGYVPEGATAMLLTLSGQKAYGALEDDDCAIYFRNIEVYIIDEIPPTPVGIEYGERRELGTPEMRRMKDYYGIGEDVYWDIEFNEPVYINDPEYLAYARHLIITQGNDDELYKFLKTFMRNLTVLEFIEKRLTDQFPKDTAILEHVRQNNGRTVEQQFGKLRLKFKYTNSDGSDKTGYAEVVDKSLYNKETYGNDYSKQIKFRYAIRPGDAFKAENIYEMTLEGGIITDNSFNAMSDSCRVISFDSKSESGLNNIYRKYTRNFNVETSPPVLLEINGGEPDGQIDQFTKLKLYFKFNEPVYMTLSDDAFNEHGIDELEFNKDSIANRITLALTSISLNSQFRYQNGYSWIADNSLGPPVAYYSGGNGTSLLAFSYYVRETDFDPLEITGSDFEMYGGSSCGEIYVMDAAGNKAPLLQDKNIKLSNKKRYIADRKPPEVSAQSTKAGDGKDGFYLTINAEDEGSGVDYDNLYFGVGYSSTAPGEIFKNMKPLAPGRKYHSGELSEMFGIDLGKEDILRVGVEAKDRSGNYLCNEMGGWAWWTDIKNDSAIFTLIGCEVDKTKYSSNYGHFNAKIGYGSTKAPDFKYKWVSEGFNPDTEDWLQAHTYSIGTRQFSVSGPGPSVYIYGGADLYLKASGTDGNETVFCIPGALEYKDLYYMEGDVRFDFSGEFYYCKAYRFASRGIGVLKEIKGLWYCLSEKGTPPEFPGNSGLWKYKAGDSVQAFEYDANPKERKGLYFMHVIAVGDDDKPIGRATSPDMMFYNFDKGKIVVESERMGDGSIVVRPSVISDFIRRKDFRVEYDINNLFNVHDWKRLPDNGEIILGRELLNPRAGLEIRAIGPDGSEIKYGSYFGDGTGGINNPFVMVNLHNRYGDKSYTNENFAELFTDTEADEFSYSLDGSSWSSWLPFKKGNIGADGFNSVLYVPLPQREGEITFYTKYRKIGIGTSDAVKSSVIRDVTPPTGSVEYSSYGGSDYWFNAKLKDLSDNLCPGQAVEVIGDKDKIISVDEPEYFLIKDVAGNMAEIKAYKKPIIVIPPVKYHDDDDDYDPVPTDTEAPTIEVIPNGNESNAISVSPQIKVRDNNNIARIEYAFSMDGDIESVTSWKDVSNESHVNLTCEDAGDRGLWYLHVRAADVAGNTAKFTSEPYSMVEEYTEPYIVYSGEHEGVMRAFLVSQEPITVSEKVYDLRIGDEYTFDYTYDSDMTTGHITTDWEFDPEFDMYEHKGTIEMTPYGNVTSNEVKVVIEAREDGAADIYYDYDNYIELIPEKFDCDENAQNQDMIDNGKIRIMIGRVMQTGNPDPIRVIDSVYGEDYLDAGLLDELAEDEDYYLEVYKAEITFDENGYLMYQAGDGTFTVGVGHIVDEDLEDNVTVAMGEGSRWAYIPWSLLASSNKFAGMLKAPVSLSGADITPPSGRVTYISADPKKGPVTAELKMTDDGAGGITVANNGGSSRRVFDTNGQFVFEFVDEAGNIG
ncbi:MAG TPA: hypothetical protein PLW11_07615, partial [Bacillota bacterium]|nr:hypothetical protein [Bacillota bacterium]